MSEPRDWVEQKYGGIVKNLGFGLLMSVHYEQIERLPPDAPKWNVSIFGNKTNARATTEEEGKATADDLARLILKTALERLGEETK